MRSPDPKRTLSSEGSISKQSSFSKQVDKLSDALVANLNKNLREEAEEEARKKGDREKEKLKPNWADALVENLNRNIREDLRQEKLREQSRDKKPDWAEALIENFKRSDDHTKNFKGLLATAGVITALLFWWGWYAYSDYTWSDSVTRGKAKEGWVVASTQANLLDPTHPWTIFKQPVVRIAFVKPKDFRQLSNGLVHAEVLWVNYVNMSRTEEDRFRYVFDFRNGRSALVEDSTSPDSISATELKWRDDKSGSAKAIAATVRDNL